MFTYLERYDAVLATRLRHRYGTALEAVQLLGFEEFTYCGEQWFPGSLLIAFPITLFALLKREVITSDWALRLIDHYPVLYHSEPATYATINALGVSYTSGFTDGAVVMTTNTNSNSMDRPAQQFFRTAILGGPISAIWTLHQEHVQRRVAAGARLRPGPDFQDFVALGRRYDAQVFRKA
ncbi:MAG TPA: hypothetical protein VD886_03365 [Herpetosiphonaceae bacterium]|nr:hypothetical protein [Herpetosiphonaceae bacterium]